MFKYLSTNGCMACNSFLTINGKPSVMTGTLLCVFGSCERHSEITEKMYIPLRPITIEDSSTLTFL